MQVTSANYVEQANVTLSNEFHSHKVGLLSFQTALTTAAARMQQLDRIKKTLFYGRETGLPQVRLSQSMQSINISKRDEVIIHAIIGLATEAGELLEHLAHWMNGDIGEFDFVNLKEESGDCAWYMAVLAKAAGFTFDEMLQINIDKLRKRYGDKFSAFDANNRDLLGERAVLESAYISGDGSGVALQPIEETCVCKEMSSPGIIHQADAPCYVAEQTLQVERTLPQFGAFDALPFEPVHDADDEGEIAVMPVNQLKRTND